MVNPASEPIEPATPEPIPAPGARQPPRLSAGSSALGRLTGLAALALLFAPWWPSTEREASMSAARTLALSLRFNLAVSAPFADDQVQHQTTNAAFDLLLDVALAAVLAGALGLAILPRRPGRRKRVFAALATLSGYVAMFVLWYSMAIVRRDGYETDEGYLRAFAVSFVPLIVGPILAWRLAKGSEMAHMFTLFGSVAVAVTASPCTHGGWGAHVSAFLIGIAGWRELTLFDESQLWISDEAADTR